MPRPTKATRNRRQQLLKAREVKEKQKNDGKGSNSTKDQSMSVTSQATPPAAQPRSVNDATLQPGISSAKKRKIILSPSPTSPSTSHEENVIVRKSVFTAIASNIACKECLGTDITSNLISHQADTSVVMQCNQCKNVIVNTVTDNQVQTTVKNIHVITLMITYLSMLFGLAYCGVEKICGLLSIRHFTRDVYMRYANYITHKTVQHTKSLLEQSRKAVFSYYAQELDRHPDENGILDVDAIFDGTWHTRGHSSSFGAGAVIDANTRLILDYETCGKICQLCIANKTRHERKEITDTEFARWKENHAPSCQVNYAGTAGGMEAAEALACWNRSLSHNMRYINFISDGDSSAYSSVTSCNNGEGPYGKDHLVEKMDCINHVAKRLGNGLRNLRKETQTVKTKSGKIVKRSVLGGQNKLTDKVITRLQFYFRRGITRKVDMTEEEMRNDIMSSFEHCSSSDTNPKHHLCPKSSDSWCFYQKALALGEVPPSHSKMKVSFSLEPDQLQLVRKVYERLVTDEMMKRCLKGHTQNPNESFHSRLWQYCPKHLNTSKNKLDFSVAHAVSVYNAGYKESVIYESLGLPFSQITEKYLHNKDKKMDIPLKKRMRNKRLQKELHYSPGGH
ncbi:uncharacterized protein LOC135107567 [Scylla paramamosain]|uniref:uncharacterized protein LOC135107567 n=1 Tax=Scylla paramamosain TaxID=85552 RepID=UPI003082C323